ncbi:MAG: type II toxin-antitoxin system VapC family toxin [Leptolyngbya sp. SIO4C5]|nr:type II toxin-antitoxin system VapC family toxin [Leptolyngbya sp. SIO4C5]
MTRLLVDTDILIDIANRDETAINRLKAESQQGPLAISSITVMELIVGCRNKQEQNQLEDFLAQFQVIALDGKVSTQAIALLKNYCLSHGLLIADALIAATAIANNIALLSKNQRDFRFIQELELLAYP